MKKVFLFQDYKAYLRAVIEANHSERGYQSKLAVAAGCQKTYLSQVLNGAVHLTPDHAANLCNFLHLISDEADYFIDLVNLQRAASPNLKRRLHKRLAHLREKDKDFSYHIAKPTINDEAAQARYYGSWYMAAIHVLTSIKEFQTPSAIAVRLGLSDLLVMKTLGELEAFKLVERRGDCWVASGRDLHLPRNSPYNLINHSNWRHVAVSRIQKNNEEDLHYTGIHALSRADSERFAQMLRDTILRTRKLVAPSPEETIVCFNCDFFTL